MTSTRAPADNHSAPHRRAGAAGVGTGGLVALSSAAILTVYAAGYHKTKAAADRFASESSVRRPPGPAQRTQPTAGVVEAVPVGVSGIDAPPVRARAGAAAAAPVVPKLTRVEGASAATTAAVPPAFPSPESVVLQTVSDTTAGRTAVDDSVPQAAAPKPVAVVEPAPAPAAAAKPAPAAQDKAAVAWKDGTYFGWGTSRHGDIQVAVTIEEGRIVDATISQCLTRYSCSWISALPPQVVARQSPDVDYVSGATQSANAFYYAVVGALARAR
ncbi:MAG: FMN-binding protein [Gemmatimonadota bacterium]|nr:FMN-binding protein [Gemmatimonadota bacterium]